MNGPYRLTGGTADVTGTSLRLTPLKTLPSFTRLSRGENKLEMATSNRSG